MDLQRRIPTHERSLSRLKDIWEAQSDQTPITLVSSWCDQWYLLVKISRIGLHKTSDRT